MSVNKRNSFLKDLRSVLKKHNACISYSVEGNQENDSNTIQFMLGEIPFHSKDSCISEETENCDFF